MAHTPGTELWFGLELYTVNEMANTDLPGTLRQVAGLGYRDIELPGFYGRAAAELRRLISDAGLVCRAIHVPPQAWGAGMPCLDEHVGRLAEEVHVLGAEYVVVPIFRLPESFELGKAGETAGQTLLRAAAAFTTDDWLRNADYLNTKASLLRKEGLSLAYHNHNPEFAPVGNTTGFALLLENTDPDLVHFEIDVGWVRAAGWDPAEVVQRYPGRFRLMHLKDLSAETQPNTIFEMSPTEVGQGIVDWKTLLPFARSAGVQEFFVEQEPLFAMPPMESARISLEYLRGFGS